MESQKEELRIKKSGWFRWPWVSRTRFERLKKKSLDYIDLLRVMNEAQLYAMAATCSSEQSAIAMMAAQLKHENDRLKWRLMELDPEFVRELEPQYVVVGPNAGQPFI